MNKLTEIFDHKRHEVEAAKSRVPEADLRAVALGTAAIRGFRKALLTDPNPIALIAEVKKASPSEGLIRPDFDPVDIAQTYERGGAACLSVLTDEKYFGGSADNLRLARQAVAIPLLRKDFIFDEYQLWEAMAWGADAVLLIVAMLDSETLTTLFQQAKEMGLDVLVEVHDERETEAALKLGADLIGVNNRDLSTFKTDLATSDRLIPLITPHAVAVSESAISTPEDIKRVQAAGARAVLVGTTLCRAPNIERAMQELLAGVE